MYIDPGFGGMLLQAIVVIAAVAGSLAYSFRRKISGFFKKDADKTKSDGKNASESMGDDIDILGGN